MLKQSTLTLTICDILMTDCWQSVINKHAPLLDRLACRPLKQQQSMLRAILFDRNYSSNKDKSVNWPAILLDLWRHSTSNDHSRAIIQILDKYLTMTENQNSSVILEIISDVIDQSSDIRLLCERASSLADSAVFRHQISANNSSICEGLLSPVINSINSMFESDHADNNALACCLNALLSFDRCLNGSTAGNELLRRYRDAFALVLNDRNVAVSFDCRQLAAVGLTRFLANHEEVAAYFSREAYTADLSCSLLIARALFSKRHRLLTGPQGLQIVQMIWQLIESSMECLPCDLPNRIVLIELLQWWLEYVQSAYPHLLVANIDSTNQENENPIISAYFGWFLKFLDDPVSAISSRIRVILDYFVRTGSESICRRVYQRLLISDDSPNKYRMMSYVIQALSGAALIELGSKSIAESLRLLEYDRLSPSVSDYYLQLLLKTSQYDTTASSCTATLQFNRQVYAALAGALTYPNRQVRELVGERVMKQFCKILRHHSDAIKRTFTSVLDCLPTDDRYYMHAVVQLAKLAKKLCSYYESELFPLDKSLLLDCFHDYDSNLRCDAFQLLVDSAKLVGDISQTVLSTAVLFLREGFIYDGPIEYRRRCVDTVERLLDRISATINRYDRMIAEGKPCDADDVLGQITEFFRGFSEWIPNGFYPNSPFHLSSVHAALLLKFVQTFQKHDEIYSIVLTRSLMARLLWMLKNNHSGMREMAFNILCQIENMWTQEYSEQLCQLDSDGLRLIGSFKASESECGAMIRFLLGGRCNQYEQVMANLEATLQHVAGSMDDDLRQLIFHRAPCGHLILLKLIVDNLPEICNAGSGDGDDKEAEFNRLFQIISGYCNRVMPLLSNQSPEGAQLATAADEDGNDDLDPVDDDRIVLSAQTEGQILSSVSWRIVKHCCDLLKTLVERRFASAIAGGRKSRLPSCVTLQSIEHVAGLVHRMLESIRHCGAFNAVYPIYNSLCMKIFALQEIQSRGDASIIITDGKSLLSEWLDGHLQEVENRRLSITRRSAGLPFLIISVLNAECSQRSTSLPAAPSDSLPNDEGSVNLSNRHQLLARTMNRMLAIAQQPVSQRDVEENSTDLTQVHALNVIHFILRDTRLSIHTQFYVEIAMMLAIAGFDNACWAIRNCSTMLFASLIKRIVGSKLTNRVRFSKFIDDYPKLFNYIRDILTKAKISNSTNNGSILPALCLLSKLNPTHIESKSRWQESVELLDPILFIATSSRNEIARRMAAKAFIPVSESSNGQISLSDLFSNLHGNSNNLNFIFGLLTVVRTVLNHRCPPRPDTQAEQGDNPSVATDSVDCKYATESASVASELLNEFSGRCNWLLRHQCIPIRALCYQMLFETVYDRRWCSPTLMNSPSLDETMRSLAMKILDDKCDSMDVIALHQLQKYRSLITMASAAYQHEGCCLRHLTALVSDNSQSYEARVSVLERLRMARSFMNFVDEKQFTVFILQFARDTLDQCKSLVGWESAASRLALKSCLRLIIELFQRGGLMQDVDTFVFDYRCCWQLISSTEFGLELRALAVELLGYLVDKESSSMDNWLDVVNLYSVETAALDLRSACVRSIKPVIGRCLFSLSAEQTYRLLVDCIARRLLQDDNDLIREECALLISKAFRECCTDSCIRRPYLSPDSAVKAIFEYILRIPRDPSGATILVRCMINTLIDADNRLAAITRLSNGQLFNNEKANVMKDELMDVRLTIQCLEKLVHSEPPVCRRESSLFELLACRLSELRDGGNLYGLRDAQMLEMRCDYLQQAASL